MLAALTFLSQLKIKTEASNKRMLDKWDYSCNQNLPYEKSFASTKNFALKQDRNCK